MGCSCRALQGAFWRCLDEQGGVLDPYYLLPAGQSISSEWCRRGVASISTSAYHAALNVSLPAPYSITTAWVNPLAGFDNVAVSIWTLFQVRAPTQAVSIGPACCGIIFSAAPAWHA